MKRLLTFLIFLPTLGDVLAHEVGLETIVVQGRQVNLVGDAVSASEGVIGQKEIDLRPLGQTGEVLELIPGMVVTQHSGSGKANQYFLRGFNLDHGTDFATVVDGMPVNMRSHAHGQGYTDLSFVIPETVAQLNYQKGAYYANIGDFSGAGGVQFSIINRLPRQVVSVTAGEEGYQRALMMADFESGSGHSLLAFELQRYDGPWTDVDEEVRKINLMLRQSYPLNDGELNVSLMGYDNHWNSADQIPVRAVQQNLIDQYGSIDDTLGGESSRYSFNISLQNGGWRAFAYAIDYELSLWSNFTYFLDDGMNGDQFQQVDDRQIYGGDLEYRTSSLIAGLPVGNRFGFQYRHDDIAEVGLYHTRDRKRLGVTRSDEINQYSNSFFWENRVDWHPRIRTVFGLRYDSLRFHVRDNVGINRFGLDLSRNGGTAQDDLISAKGSAIYSINDAWETYVSAGEGFHSNDARGTTIMFDPVSGVPANQVDPLVRSRGFEVGARGFINEAFNVSFALWTLQLDSELLFVGDAGGTEASRPSSREGFEAVIYYHVTDEVSVDLEYAVTDAEFTDSDPIGRKIPGAVRDVLQAGLNLDSIGPWFGSLRYRYFGNRPLREDGSIESEATSAVNLRLGYERPAWRVTLDVFNLTDSNDHDITYLYESRLAGELRGGGAEELHFHPIEPRALRVSLELRW